MVLALMTLVALLGSLLAVISPPQAARAEVTGTGGQFVPVTGNARVYSGSTVAKSYKTIKIAGVDGLPATGIGAVTLAVQVNDVKGQGQFVGRPNSSTADTLMLIYGAGVSGNASDSSLLAVSDDGSVQIKTETAQANVIIDVTGYYTSTKNGVAGGGYVPVSPTVVADTRDGTGVRQVQVGGGDAITFQVTGKGDVPQAAAAAQISVVIRSQGGNSGAIRVYPSSGDPSSGRLSYSPEAVNTSVSAQVALGSDGKLTVDNTQGGATLDLVVSVQGYFTPSNPGGGFTPQTGRLADTRSGTGTGSSVPSGSSLAVQVAGALTGIPTVESGLVAAAVTLTTVNNDTRDAAAKVWADGASEPSAVSAFSESGSTKTTTVIAPVGKNGVVRIKNQGAGTLNFVVDLQGTYNSLPGGPASTNQTGQRTSATRLPFTVTDQTSASVDVGTGNLMVSTAAMSLPGATQSTPIGATYNSRSTHEANTNTMDANRWQYGLAGAGNLTANALGVVYLDGQGTAWQFTRAGAGTFTSPAGLQQTLTRTLGTDDHYEMKGWTTNQTIHFNLAGQPTSIDDRNKTPNTIGFNYSKTDSYVLQNIQSTAGTTAAKTLQLTYANGTQTFTQTSGNSTRSISWAKNPAGDITTYTDATGAKTAFGYTDGDLTSITAPNGGVTSFTYDSTDRVTQVSQSNTTAGSPGTAVTRLSYVDDTTTQVADPRSDQSATVANAKHTTYTLDSNDLVTKTVDPMNRERSKTYNSANNGVKTSQVGSDAGANTGKTENQFDKNNSQSLTKSQSGSGSSSSAEYGSTSPAATYLPSKVTSSSGSSTSIGYDDYGNQKSSQSGVSGAEAVIDRNDDGTVKKATAPGNKDNSTTYEYTNKQLTKIVAPTQTVDGTTTKTVGDKDYSYDELGRVKTETDGRNNTTTFGYDNDDRLLTTSFSDGTATVTNTYDGNGNQTVQTSATGTITNTYDQQNRLTSTVNTAGGGQVSYGYDLAGNTVKVADAQGTVTHDYDSSGALTATTYPSGAGTAKQLYKTDPNSGRRTDIWLNAVPKADSSKDPEVWEAHQHIEYDKSGKITKVQAWGDDNRSKPIIDTTYCYIAGATAGGTCAENTANDRDQLQWSKDNTTNQADSDMVTEYGYKGDDNAPTDRLTSVKQTGGSKPMNWKFTYDDAGNRTQATVTDVATNTVTSDTKFSFNAIGQITTAGYQYDGTGNMIAAPGETFTYNGAQQMTSSTKDGVKTTYTYAGADMNKLLSQATDGGKAYQYMYGTSDSNGVPVVTARTVAGVGTASVLNDPSSGRPLDLRTTDRTTSMWVIDGLGNPAAAITDKGAKAYVVSYSPYGGETVSYGDTSIQWQQNPYGFKTGIRSSNTSNGLTKFGYRWQAAMTGAWIQRDTLDAPLDPANGNRYAYVGSDPLNESDATGASTYDDVYDTACGIGISSSVTFGTGITGLLGGFAVSTSAGIGALAYGGACAIGGIPRYQPTLYADNPELLVATAGGY
jgi:RHS repeat-associated protein